MCVASDLCRMASPFSGKQSHVTFPEIPGQNKKSLKHNECHNLMSLEFLKQCSSKKKIKYVSWFHVHKYNSKYELKHYLE
jgi:hypothetical protein